MFCFFPPFFFCFPLLDHPSSYNYASPQSASGAGAKYLDVASAPMEYLDVAPNDPAYAHGSVVGESETDEPSYINVPRREHIL